MEAAQEQKSRPGTQLEEAYFPELQKPKDANGGGLRHQIRDPAEPLTLEFMADVPLEVAAELGRATLNIGELLNLKKGSIIELNKLAGEPLEMLFNKKLVARGEAVVVNQNYGIRITDIVNSYERIKNRVV